MPETYRVQYTHLAVAQLQEIFDHIQEVSPQNAVAMINRLLAAVEGLDLMPQRYAVVRNSRQAVGEEIRSMLVRPYVVKYHIDEAKRIVTLLSVRHGARRPEE